MNIFTKAWAILTLAGAVVIFFLHKQVEAKNKEVATLEVNAEQYQATITQLNKSQIELKNEFSRISALLEKRELTIQDINQKNRELNKQLSDLERHEPEVKNYLDVSVPDNVVRLLQQAAGQGGDGNEN